MYEKYILNNKDYDLKGNGKKIANLSYKEVSKKNKLDLYIPNSSSQIFPVVVFVHGGGLFKSDKGNHLSNVLHCLERGYAVASINYRLNDEATYKEIQNDMIDAVEWIADNADKFNLDANRIALWGETHGGYLSEVFGVMYQKGMLDRKCKVRVRGIVVFYAPNFERFYGRVLTMNKKQFAEKNANYKMEKLFECSTDELPNKLKMYEVYDKIDGSEPPFYFVHGSKDDVIDPFTTIQFSNTLTENKVSNVFHFVEGGEHGIDFYDEEEYNEPVLRFLDSIFCEGSN